MTKSVTRTRVKSDGRVYTGRLRYYTRDHAFGPYYTPDFDYYLFRNYEAMTDEVHKHLVGPAYPMGDVTHVRISVDLSPTDQYESHQFNGDWDKYPENAYMPINPQMVTDFVASPPSTTLTSLGFQAFQSMNDQIPGSVSIANFIYELKDLKELLPNVLEKKGAIGRANDSFLNANFGWRPLVGDLKKLSGIIDSINRRLDYLRSTRGKSVPVHFKRDNFWENPQVSLAVSDVEPFSPYTVSDSKYVWRLARHDVTFRASGTVYQKITGLDDASASWKALWASLGLNNPAKAIWNAYPYSFVADWFFPVDNWLSTKGLQPFTGEWSLYNVCYSVKEYAEIVPYHQSLYWDNTRKNKSLGKITMTRYTRRVGLPVSFDDAMSLSNNQQALLLSLATARTKIAK